jgi:hypothetical protein
MRSGPKTSIGRRFLDERGKLLYSPRSLRHDAPMHPSQTVSRFSPLLARSLPLHKLSPPVHADVLLVTSASCV